MITCEYCRVSQMKWGDGKCPHCGAPFNGSSYMPQRHQTIGLTSSVAYYQSSTAYHPFPQYIETEFDRR